MQAPGAPLVNATARAWASFINHQNNVKGAWGLLKNLRPGAEGRAVLMELLAAGDMTGADTQTSWVTTCNPTCNPPLPIRRDLDWDWMRQDVNGLHFSVYTAINAATPPAWHRLQARNAAVNCNGVAYTRSNTPGIFSFPDPGPAGALGAQHTRFIDVRATVGAFAARTAAPTGTVLAWGDPDTGGHMPKDISDEVQGSITALAAVVSAFACTTDTGNVLTWGDTQRYAVPQTVTDATRGQHPTHAVTQLCSNGLAFAVRLSPRQWAQDTAPPDIGVAWGGDTPHQNTRAWTELTSPSST